MWPIDIIACLATTIVFAHQNLWASMGLNVYYLVMGVVGVIAWQKDKKAMDGADSNIRVRRMSRRVYAWSGLAFVAMGLALYFILKITHDPSPVVDALVGASGVVGTVWLVRCYLENWILWIISDLISVLLCLSQGLYLMAALYLVYTLMAIVGLRNWRKQAVYID